MKIVSKDLFRLLETRCSGWHLKNQALKKMENGLNSEKMKYCKKKVVWNVLRNKNWLKIID